MEILFVVALWLIVIGIIALVIHAVLIEFGIVTNEMKPLIIVALF